MTREERKSWTVLKYGYDRNKVLRTNEDVLRAVKLSRRLGKVIDPLVPYILDAAHTVVHQRHWQGYPFLDDMESYAVMHSLKSIKIRPLRNSSVTSLSS